MLHTTVQWVLLAAPTVDPAEPPGGANLMKIAGWVLWGLGIAVVVGIAKSGALIGLAGSGRGGQGAEHGVGFVLACVGAAICFTAGTIAAVFG